MEISNMDEYQIIRVEMERLKNCITTYMGYVLGGSGAFLVSIYALGRYVFEDNNGNAGKSVMDNAALVAVALLLLAITISLVLHIIFYKFNSHNRYAGYCKLLNQERLQLNQAAVGGSLDVMSWETCVDILRDSDFEESPFAETIGKLRSAKIISSEEDEEYLRSILGSKKSADQCKHFNGLFLIIRSLFGRDTTRSWQFPLYVVRVFLSICAFYLGFSFYYVFHSELPMHICEVAAGSSSYGLIYYTLLSIIAIMWLAFAGQLYKVMYGSSTVDAYCWRFLPIRFTFINRKNPDIDYSLITLK